MPHSGCSVLHGVNPNLKKYIQHEKKPVSSLKNVQSVVFEQTSKKFIEIFVL